MTSISLVSFQKDLIERPIQSKIFLEGQAGSGKTTVGVERMLELLARACPPSADLLLVPQRTLAPPYQDGLRRCGASRGWAGFVLTVGGLAQAHGGSVLAADRGRTGFARPDLPPSFLTLETALYYMAYLVRPLLEQGFSIRSPSTATACTARSWTT